MDQNYMWAIQRLLIMLTATAARQVYVDPDGERVMTQYRNGTHWSLQVRPLYSLNETLVWEGELLDKLHLNTELNQPFGISFSTDSRYLILSKNNIDRYCTPQPKYPGLTWCKFVLGLRPGHCLRYDMIYEDLEDAVWEVKGLGRFQNLTLSEARIELDSDCDISPEHKVKDPMENFSSLKILIHFEQPSNVTDGLRWLPPADCEAAHNTTRVECSNLTFMNRFHFGFNGIYLMYVTRPNAYLLKFRCHISHADDRFNVFVSYLMDTVLFTGALRELDISAAQDLRFCSWAVMASAISLHLRNISIVDCPITQIDSIRPYWVVKFDAQNSSILFLHPPEAYGVTDELGTRSDGQRFSLERVDLAGNHLRQLPRWLHNLTSLTRANLSGQLLGPGERFSLTNSLLGTAPFLPALEVLDLSLVPLKDFTSNASRQFPRLRQLHLRQCGLTELEESVFEPLPLLSWLDLSGNHLSTLQSTLFSSLASLRTLHLCCNTFQSLQQPLLLGGNLAYLDLSHNQLGRHSLQIRAGNITSLNLSSNAIADWSSLQPLALSDRHVRRVDLSGNEIHLLEPQMRDELRDLLELDLTGNLFDCKHCQLHELQHWISSNQHRLSGSEELFCEDPESKQRGLRVLEAPYNPECLPDLFLHVGVPLLAVSALLLLVGTLLYVYRFHVAYVRHLWKIKRQHEKRGLSAEEAVEYDAFVSYSGEDREWVMETLLPNMESEDQHGYRFCLHERDFEVGSYIMENIGHRIATSGHVVLLLSPHFVRSKWCQFELRLAQLRMFEDGTRGGADFLVLVQLQPLERRRLSNTLRLLMATRTFLEWPHNATSAKGAEQSGQRREFFKRLRAALGPPCKNKMDPFDISNLAYEEEDEM